MTDTLLDLEEYAEVATPEGQALNARRIIELLRFRHPEPEWASFVELPTSTGFAGSGARLDFFALHTWPSKGNVSIAYEVKVSRNDFANELRKPTKRQDAEALAHECYFVVPHNLVKPDEVPEGWGLVYANRGGLRRVKMATQRTPAPWPRTFIAALARRSSDKSPKLIEPMWKVLGQEVNERELLEIAARHLDKHISVERAIAAEEVRTSAEYREMRELRTAVGRVVGAFNCTAAQFQAWYEKATKSEEIATARTGDWAEQQALVRIRNLVDQILEARRGPRIEDGGEA
jgi:hypothetical protein